MAGGYISRLCANDGAPNGVRTEPAHAAVTGNGGGLYELWPRGSEGIGRVFYCFLVGRRVVILHAFVKKTEDTPKQELRIARRRMKEVLDG